MKKLIAFGTLTLTSLFGAYHDPVAGLHIDVSNFKGLPEFHLNLNHQSTFDFGDNSAIILHGLHNPYSHKTFHNEIGVGFRRIFENFGFGTNIVYAHRNTFGFLNHHLAPGIELFYKDFVFVYNRYLPLSSRVQFGQETYLFHDVSEISLSYRLSQKYEFSLTPHINHQTKQVGVRGSASAYVFDNIELTLAPYFDQTKKSVEFSVIYHFRGVTKKINRKLNKTHNFFHTSDKKEVEKYKDTPSSVFVPVPAPIVITPEPIVDPKPKETKNWWDYIGSWKSSNVAPSNK